MMLGQLDQVDRVAPGASHLLLLLLQVVPLARQQLAQRAVGGRKHSERRLVHGDDFANAARLAQSAELAVWVFFFPI